MSGRLRVFVSSVQRELESERLILQNLMSTDAFLSSYCEPILFELEPASPIPALEGCITSLDACQVYILIVGMAYGTFVGDISITHSEYRHAKGKGLPILVFIKGERTTQREAGTSTLLEEIEADGLKYKRFSTIIELQKEVRAALVRLLGDTFGISPTSDENLIAEHTIEATSSFESRLINRVLWRDLDMNVARNLVAAAEGQAPEGLEDDALLSAALVRGLVWYDSEHGEYFATSAGIVLLAKDPSIVFPQCRILADAYRGAEPDGEPRDHEDIRGPMSLAIDRSLAFIDRNTRHPMRIVGLNRLRLDEYPDEALREALVNAVAHRQYEDAGRKIMLEVFADKIIISSPGLPPAPITVARLRSGKYRPCSRNPVLAQNLAYFHRIEERGSGFRRMRDRMLDHGLDQPLIATDTGYFQIIFPGPGENIERITVPEKRLIVTPTIETQLNERQKAMVAILVRGEMLTSRRCEEEFGITRDTANRDFMLLTKLGVARKEGKGRATHYILVQEK